MRGVLALAAALSLPERLANGQPFPQRSLIIFLAFSCIFATLVLQGLSMPALIRRLGLAGSSVGEQEERATRYAMVTGALSAIAELKVKGTYDQNALDAMENYYQRQLALLEMPDSSPTISRNEAEALLQLAHELRQVERNQALRMRDEYKIHDEVLRTVERELDLLDARFKDA
jgi:CPA1 family monovalent cation:H+ antiporter